MKATHEIEILPKFYPLVDSTHDVILTWGGRDSGKSYALTQILALKAMQPEYFRCILVKKTYESIKDAQWQSLKDFVYDAGLHDYFRFTQSPLEIECTLTGNKFIARGCDKPEKLKSISNPSHVWYEEGNQLTQEDYETISTTLRSNKTKVQEWFSFNPETKGNYTDFWLYQMFFKGQTQKSFERTLTIKLDDEEVTLNYISIHSTYHDNKFVTAERKARHENLKNTNPYRYKVFTLGEWGNEENDSPFFYGFDKDRHYRDEPYTIDPSQELTLSFDFNAEPCTCIVGQLDRRKRTANIIGAHYAEASSHKGALEVLCDQVRNQYQHTRYLIRVTGDSAGKHKDADRPKTVNRYSQICTYLQIAPGQVAVEKHNINHASSRDLCNDVLQMIPPGHFVFWAGTEKLIEEIQASYPDDKDSLNKAKKELGLHGVDAFRYLIKYWFAFGLNRSGFARYRQQVENFVRGIPPKVLS